MANRLLEPFQTAHEPQHPLGQQQQILPFNRSDEGVLQAVPPVVVYRFRRPAQKDSVLPLCGGGDEPAVLSHFGQPAGCFGQAGKREIGVFRHRYSPFVIHIRQGQGFPLSRKGSSG